MPSASTKRGPREGALAGDGEDRVVELAQQVPQRAPRSTRRSWPPRRRARRSAAAREPDSSPRPPSRTCSSAPSTSTLMTAGPRSGSCSSSVETLTSMYSGAPRSSLISGLRRRPLQPSSFVKWQKRALSGARPERQRCGSPPWAARARSRPPARGSARTRRAAPRGDAHRLAEHLSAVGADVDVGAPGVQAGGQDGGDRERFLFGAARAGIQRADQLRAPDATRDGAHAAAGEGACAHRRRYDPARPAIRGAERA